MELSRPERAPIVRGGDFGNYVEEGHCEAFRE